LLPRDSRRPFVAGRQRGRLPRVAMRRNIGFNTNRSIRGPMFNARNSTPLPPAFAAGTVMRAWQPSMTHLTVSIPIYRGVMR